MKKKKKKKLFPVKVLLRWRRKKKVEQGTKWGEIVGVGYNAKKKCWDEKKYVSWI